MSINSTISAGVIHGTIIQLERSLDFPDGQRVTVTVVPVALDETHAPGEGLRKAFGSWAEGADELDAFLKWNREQRKISHNTQDFVTIPGLKLIDWMSP